MASSAARVAIPMSRELLSEMEEAEMFSLSILVVLLRLMLRLSAAVVTLVVSVNSPGSDTFQGFGIPGPIQSEANRFASTVSSSFALKSTLAAFGLVQVT